MGTRRPDKIELVTKAGSFDRFSRLSVTNDILGQAEATFETGDETSWPDIEKLLEPGTPVSLVVNGRPRLLGRSEIVEAEASPDGGVSAVITLRTKMADARYRSADPATKTNATSIKKFILACYKPLGLTESDFTFDAFADVDLMTGKASPAVTPINMDPMQPEQAKVTPPETIFDAVEKHLRRFGAYHWDGSRGKIIVGIPNDTKPPRYRMTSKSASAGKGNTILRCRRIRDWSEVAQEVWVTGSTMNATNVRKSLKSRSVDEEVLAVANTTGNFQRLVIIPAQGAYSAQAAKKQADRELSLRRRRKDGWEFTTDGWSYWSGSEQINYAPAMTVDVDVDALGGAHGRYFIVRTALNLTLDGAVTTSLTCVATGTLLG